MIDKEKRFLIALFNLCLDHGYVIHGFGQEDYMYIEALSNRPAIAQRWDGKVFMLDVGEGVLPELRDMCKFIWEA